MLRTLGASRAQMMRAVVEEGLLLGVVGAVVGLVAGIGLAPALDGLFKAFGADLPDSGTVLEMRTVWVSLGVGTAVTVAAGFFPALRATRVTPIAALREGVSRDATPPRRVVYRARRGPRGRGRGSSGCCSAGASRDPIVVLALAMAAWCAPRAGLRAVLRRRVGLAGARRARSPGAGSRPASRATTRSAIPGARRDRARADGRARARQLRLGPGRRHEDDDQPGDRARSPAT